jgi:AcrR family transcriptional regulator
MTKTTPDRRIGKTRNALADAMFRLIQREDWNAITIQAICTEANVARASFYTHFSSRIDLLEFMLARNLGDLAVRMSELGDGGLELLDWFVEHVTSSRSRFTKIAVSTESHPAMARFKALIADQFAQALKLGSIGATRAQVDFILGGTMDLITTWAKTWRMTEVPELRANVRTFAARILLSQGPEDGKPRLMPA